MKTTLPLEDSGTMNVFRYHPIPPGNAPPPGVAGLSLLKFPSMLQSWGTSTSRHCESFDAGSTPPGTSPRWNLQPELKSWVFLIRVVAPDSESPHSIMRPREAIESKRVAVIVLFPLMLGWMQMPVTAS